MIELIDLKHLTQDQLITIINKSTALLEHDRYPETHLYINGTNAEKEYWWDESK